MNTIAPISTVARRARRATLPWSSGSLSSVTAWPAGAARAGLLDSMGTGISHSSESSVVAVQLTRQHVINMLRTAGLSDMADAAQRDLPDPVDSEQAAAWAARYGINMGELMDRMGGSHDVRP